MTGTDRYDAIVVGGSFAGLQTALTLGRACRRVLVVDGGEPRNARAAHVHNFFGQPGPTPQELHAAARAALDPYAVDWIQDLVVAAEPTHTTTNDEGGAANEFDHTSDNTAWPGWRLSGSRGDTWEARAVVLATGLRDELPEVPGVADLWGRDVVSCPHCHGWEVRGEQLAQLGMRGEPAKGVERAALLSRWTTHATLFTDGDALTADQAARMRAAGVAVVETPVRRLVHADGRLDHLELEDGRTFTPRTVFTVTRQRQQIDATALFGCQPAPDGVAIAADASGRTGVPGVWAAGTAAVPALLAVGAAGHGAAVALTLHTELLEQELAGAHRATPIPTAAHTPAD